MDETLLLTFNAGSSTVKIGIFQVTEQGPVHLGKAAIDLAAVALTLVLRKGLEGFNIPLSQRPADLAGLIDEVFEKTSAHFDLDRIIGAGHRIVHGGDVFTGPVALNDETIAQIEMLGQLAPLHQPQALRLIAAVRDARPDLFQSASFDTTFHASQPDVVRRLAIPRVYYERGIKRYGFHGLSYQYVVRSLRSQAPEVADGKVVIAHLGSGASLCGVHNGASRDSSMGFSTLDGIPMATRPGWLDPGVILHLLGPGEKSLREIEDILYNKSGLLGLSGISGDVRVLIENDAEEARQALELFTIRIAGEICRLASTLEGLDAVVFTAGIGEHQPLIRARVAERLLWLGFALDPEENATNALKISTAASRVAVYVIPTDEELMIAEECLAVLLSTENVKEMIEITEDRQTRV
ncbi:acetate/propionate family kinase [Rhizobium sp. 18065]|uniref:acetate/propionate family kinase n=1 Tax=Rhizobium sp. 18065 TaxID=2681411 RepID=UPI001356CC1A|nr:acetate/propionate family kinase [Rhizobium sp. 18065]